MSSIRVHQALCQTLELDANDSQPIEMTLAPAVLAIATAHVGRADAPPDRYEVTADTVKDLKTRLIWQRNTEETEYTWRDAASHCRALGTGWRLPALKELLTLVDPVRGSPPMIDVSAFPNTSLYPYWTASPFASDPLQAWGVEFNGGGNGEMPMDGSHFVRCVR